MASTSEVILTLLLRRLRGMAYSGLTSGESCQSGIKLIKFTICILLQMYFDFLFCNTN
jgi:hypothetical protein